MRNIDKGLSGEKTNFHQINLHHISLSFSNCLCFQLDQKYAYSKTVFQSKVCIVYILLQRLFQMNVWTPLRKLYIFNASHSRKFSSILPAPKDNILIGSLIRDLFFSLLFFLVSQFFSILQSKLFYSSLGKLELHCFLLFLCLAK